MRKYLILASVIFLFGNPLCSFEVRAQSYSALFYNLENLFYPEVDTSRIDNEFTVEGARHWSWYKYRKKINSVCKVIIAAGEWHPPYFIALCELENRMVLEDICRNALLRNYDYGIVHRDSPDHRGMDVAILFRKEHATLLEEIYLQPRNEKGHLMASREILLAKFLVGADTLVLSMNHWTSKYGGELETEGLRILQAELLARYVDSLLSLHPDYYLLAGGDFNDERGSKSMLKLINFSGMSELEPDNYKGTYKYQGRWGYIDHVFVGGAFPEKKSSVRIVNLPILLEDDEKNGGQKPFRTFLGYRYHGGISDHLPLLFLFGEEGP